MRKVLGWIVPIVAIGSAVPAHSLYARPQSAASPQADQPDSFRAMAGSQTADGVTDGDMDQTFLDNLEAYLITRITVNTQRALDARGLHMTAPTPTASSVYILTAGHKLAVTRLQARSGSGIVYTVQVLGIFGADMRRVLCVSTAAPVAITYGPCAAKIEETFGFALNGTAR